VAHNPIDGEEAYLISVRSTDTLMFVRKRDGAIIWRSPKGLVNTQHDPAITAKGTILVFDNGFTRLPNPYPLYGSRVVEIDPRTNTLLWKFDGGPGVMDKFTFYGALVGGAQPLPNGNVLITDGPRGHMFEVTHAGEIVWDMISPYTTKSTGAFPINFLFKARRYTSKTVRFPSGIAPAFNPIVYSLLRLLRPIYPN
jgi:outer membrane protein assembly factor BamB